MNNMNLKKDSKQSIYFFKHYFILQINSKKYQMCIQYINMLSGSLIIFIHYKKILFKPTKGLGLISILYSAKEKRGYFLIIVYQDIYS